MPLTLGTSLCTRKRIPNACQEVLVLYSVPLKVMSTKPQGSAEKSPDFLQAVFKKYRKISLSDLEQDPDVVDFSTERNLETYKHLRNIREIDCSDSQPELGGDLCTTSGNPLSRKPVFVYEHAHLPGRFFEKIGS